MSLYRILVSFYSHLYSEIPFLNCLLGTLRWVTRHFSNALFPLLLGKKVLRRNIIGKRDRRIIVSLTSFPARIAILPLVIKGLFKQRVLPDKIILWLSLEQFPGKRIPQELEGLRNEIFEVRFIDGDLRSHKKYFYAFNQFPDDYVILIDDDIYYDVHLVERLVAAAGSNNNAIICRHGSILNYGEDGKLRPFSDRTHIEKATIDQNFFFGSGGGTLFIPSQMYKDCLRDDLFKELTPIADDVWLNAMGRLAGLKTVKIWGGLLLPVYIKNNETLCSTNLEKSFNDVQIENVSKWYKQSLGVDPFKKR